ncbi:hypothetical protein [Yersinia aleksiciae]|uniref:hypothetical protein n=1 Tax=Yersinia aleksiciae TaxID=263819 RepID=UPI00119DB9FA|nr:hypothetical protein [Yersinia aleksiciae]
MSDSINSEKVEITELLKLVSDLRREVNVLNVAFSYLPFSLPDDTLRATIEALRYESNNNKRTVEQRAAFENLVTQMDERTKGQITIP